MRTLIRKLVSCNTFLVSWLLRVHAWHGCTLVRVEHCIIKSIAFVMFSNQNDLTHFKQGDFVLRGMTSRSNHTDVGCVNDVRVNELKTQNQGDKSA